MKQKRHYLVYCGQIQKILTIKLQFPKSRENNDDIR